MRFLQLLLQRVLQPLLNGVHVLLQVCQYAIYMVM